MGIAFLTALALQGQLAAEKHWAFAPLSVTIPEIDGAGRTWSRSPVDRFIWRDLAACGLEPAPRAADLELLRRATMDLTGLPPSEEESEAFLRDERPDAFPRLVDRLLASPRYGERWGRDWLDVARYATSAGSDEDIRQPFAWRYRDYVIEAFNDDLAYDRFVHEQIAGDLLAPRGKGIDLQSVIGTGFLAVGPKAVAQRDKVLMRYDVVDDQIDTVSKAFLGLTIACARCHDHKFDPITTRDYYSLASIFASTQTYSRSEEFGQRFHVTPLLSKDDLESYRLRNQRREELETRVMAAALPSVIGYRLRELDPELAEYMLAARRVYAGGERPAVVAGGASLDAERLERWVAFLDPKREFEDERDRMVFERLQERELKDWYAAADASSEREAAEALQQAVLEADAELLARAARWSEQALAALRQGKEVEEFEARTRGFHEAIIEDGPLSLPEADWGRCLPQEERTPFREMQAELHALRSSGGEPPPLAATVGEGEPVEQRVFVRGGHQTPGEAVPRQFPVVLAGTDQTPIAEGSGRREFARWLTSGASQLSSRVMANRLWLWHFGEGLVVTPNNFGTTGERPTHPELLDYLASELVNSGWSLKHMHRLLMGSSVYQMSSRSRPGSGDKDPANRLWSRFPRRRLAVEELRDSLLFVGGSLDLTMGGTLQPELGDSQRGSSSPDPPYLDPAETHRRTVYIPLYRNRLPRLLTLFDFVDSTSSMPKRSTSNTAPQALFLRNSEFVDARASELASRLIAGTATTVERIRRAYRICFGRPPANEEIELATDYLRAYPQASPDAAVPELDAWRSLCRVLLASNEFHYVE